MSDPKRPPFEDVRDAFERLATPDKAAFVLEATFSTLGQAIGETGRHLADAVSSLNLDGLFRMDGEAPRDTTMDPDVAAAAAAAASTKPPAGKTAGAKKGRTPRDPGVPPTDGAPAV